MVKQTEGQTLTIYFKNKSKPIVKIDGCSKQFIDEFYLTLQSNVSFVKVSDFIFQKGEFSYATVE